MHQILSNKLNEKQILLGNNAVVRGALEAGVQFVSTYPGTPASEIGNTFFKIRDAVPGLYFEFSTNEKVAMEAGMGASFSGLKTLVAMKNFGLNVASDSLLPFLYSGSKGPTVIAVADDPNCWSSAQSEQNSRGYSYLAHLPTLEPSDPQEAKDFTKLAFEISKKFEIPVMVRLTTRVSHQKMPVQLGKLARENPAKAEFVKDSRKFVTMPPRVLEMKKELLEKIKQIRKFAEKSDINEESRIGNHELGIITSGISYLYVMETLQELELDLPVLKLGFFYPLPEEKIKNFIKPLKKVLVVEELEPWLEKEITALAKSVNPNLEIHGKNLIPEVGELKPEIVTSAIAKFTNCKLKLGNSLEIGNPSAVNSGLNCCKLEIPKRTPQLCPGCPYWFVFGAIKKVVGDTSKVIFGGDIGCYMLAGLPPHNLQDYLFSMGSSLGIGHGIKKALQLNNPSSAKASEGEQKLITLIGDGTFFHAGIPALINTVFNKSNPLIIVMDNSTTAMTGHQPHPGAPARNASQAKLASPARKDSLSDAGGRSDAGGPAENHGLKIENIVKACGVEHCRVIDPVKQEDMKAAIKEFLEKKEVSVIIARHPCVFVENRK